MSNNPIPHIITEEEKNQAIATGEPIISWEQWNEAFGSGASAVFFGEESELSIFGGPVTPKKAGRLYITTNQKIYYDTGNEWKILGHLVSDPLPGMKKVTNLYYDQNTKEIVLQTE